MDHRMPSGPRARKARRDTSTRAPTDTPKPPATPLYAVIPGARRGLTVRGPGALAWIAFLEREVRRGA